MSIRKWGIPLAFVGLGGLGALFLETWPEADLFHDRGLSGSAGAAAGLE